MNKKELKIHLCPMDLAWLDPQKNIEKMREWVKKGCAGEKDPSSVLHVFPELTLSGFSVKEVEKVALEETDPVFSSIQNLCIEYKTSIVFGYPEKTQGLKKTIRNAYILMNEEGKIQAKYYKMNLFTYGENPEASVYEKGSDPVVVEHRGWKIGFSVCFDLRFPELYQTYRFEDVDLQILGACWLSGETKSDQFKTLCRAHAVLTQSFFVGVNRSGSDPYFSYDGDAVIYGPRAEVITEKQGVFALHPEMILESRKLKIPKD